MALFQISEPGEAPAPHQRKRAIGIDLGTTNSLVATVRNGLAVVLPDIEGRPLVPSIVRYGEQGVETGYAAMAHQTDDPQNTIVSVKRMMGRGLARPRRCAALSVSLRRHARAWSSSPRARA